VDRGRQIGGSTKNFLRSANRPMEKLRRKTSAENH
jgi:hypothetical protein